METEEALSKQLKRICGKDGKEKFPKQSANIFYKLGLIYKTEGLKKADKIKLIQSAALLNAAIVRKPENVEEIMQDLCQFCSEFLNISEAANQEADLIEYSKLIANDIAEMRKRVNGILATISPIAEDISDEDFTTLKREKVGTISSLQSSISKDYTKIMKRVAGLCREIMGNPPCEYALVGLGSLSRKEITPYSDFENVIVLDDNIKGLPNNIQENLKEYFRWFTVTFQIILINLGETNISRVQIPSLNSEDKTKFNFYDAVTPLGIAFDGMMPHACKFPLGRHVKTKKKPYTLELIQTVSKMASLIGSDENVKNGYHLADMLMTSCFVAGNQRIYEQFQEFVNHEISLLDKRLYKLSIKDEVIQNKKEFHVALQLNSLGLGKNVNIKKLVYRSSTVFISAIGKIHTIKEPCCFDILESLMQCKKLTTTDGCDLKFAIAVACETRLRVYTNRKSQDDMFEPQDIQKNFIDDTLGVKSILEYFLIICQFQEFIYKLNQISKPELSLVPKICLVLGYYNFAIKWWNQQKLTKEYINNKDIYVATDIADGHFRIGLCKLNLSRYNEAISDFQNSLAIHKKFSVGPIKNKYFYFWIGKCKYQLGQFKEALIDFQKSITIHIQNNKNLDEITFYADHHYWIGFCQYELCHYKIALFHLQTSLEIVNKSIDNSAGENVPLLYKQLNLYDRVGKCKFYLCQYENALVSFQTSFEILLKITEDSYKNVETSAQHYWIGLCKYELDQYEEASTELQTSLEIFKQVVDDPTKSSVVAYRHYWIGMCKFQLNYNSEALTNFQTSLKIHQTIGKQPTRNSDDTKIYQIDLGYCNFWIGKCKFTLDQYADALVELQIALKFFQQTSDFNMIQRCCDLINDCASSYIVKFVVRKSKNMV